MAAVATTSAAATSATCFLAKSLPKTQRPASRPTTGLPALGRPKTVCSAEKKEGNFAVPASISGAAFLIASHPALALVDERLSTEGTGLSLGVSSPGLGWILVAVPALVWALFFVFSSSELPEGDDESGLSL